MKLFLLCVFCAVLVAHAQVTQLTSPNDLGSGRTTLSFDEFTDYLPANTTYASIGITFSRDDGYVVPVLAATAYGIAVPSSNYVLFSGFYPGIGPTNSYTTHIVVNSLQPLTQIGAFFGNDGYISDFAFQRLSLFGAANELIGSLDVAVNNNRNVDQFIGLRSTVPFYHARFENFTPSGTPSEGYGVALDDLTFTQVPEPSTWALIGFGAASIWLFRRRQT